MRKYRAIYYKGELVTVIGIYLHWKWPILINGAYYGKTVPFFHPKFY